MRDLNVSDHRTKHRARSGALAIALAAASMLQMSQSAHADGIRPPDVPADIQVPAGNVVFLKGAAVGTQNYACSPSGTGFAWVLFTPQATLFNRADKQIMTHFFSPNPDPSDPNTDPAVLAAGAIRPTWQARDTSSVWAKAAPSSRPVVVRPDALPWLLLEVVGRQEGPTGGDTLTSTTFIQRVNTVGGLAPSTGCAQSSDVGKKAFVPYTADYYFYESVDATDY